MTDIIQYVCKELDIEKEEIVSIDAEEKLNKDIHINVVIRRRIPDEINMEFTIRGGGTERCIR